MIDSALPSKSLIGTLVILIAFISTVILLISTFNDPLMKWFLLPLAVFIAMALIKCISNMQEYLNLLEKISEDTTKTVILKTCPEYWIKDTAYVENNIDKANPKMINICKNYKTLEDGSVQYIGGSGKGTNSKFSQNFGSSGETFNATLDNMNARFVKNSNVNESFVTHDLSSDVKNVDQAITGLGVDKLHKTVNPEYPNEFVTFHDNSRTTPWEGDSNDMTATAGTHYHHTGPLIHHANAHSSHSNIPGALWHSHANELELDESELVSESNLDKWIFSRDNKGVEINLDKLNSANNVCDLSKDFYWTEASNKCKFGSQMFT